MSSTNLRRAVRPLLTTLLRGALGTALVLGVFAVLPVSSASAATADRNFAVRFSTNDTGDIDIFGNTLMTCPSSDGDCAAAQQAAIGTSANQDIINNNFKMVFIDADSDSSTFNSSKSTVTTPAGSTILFAGLYWGARTDAGSGGNDAPNTGARNTVKFKAPGDPAYTSLTATTLDDGTVGVYQGFVDVTTRVRNAGNGTYTVANVQASTGQDTLAGWSLVVAYRDTTQPARNLTVFDGMKSINGSASGSISVSGFTTPPAGDVNTTVGFVTYEGDMGLVGDGASLNGRTLSDAQHPATNFFDSRISRDGTMRTNNTPSYPNNLGVDQSMLTVGKPFLGNGDTSATIGLTTAGDVYAPGVVTFATELYAPKIIQTKTSVDVNGGLLEQGDVLRYTISGTNSGQDGATGFILRDPIPSDTTYVAGSIRVTQPAGSATTATDAAGDDVAEYDGTNNRVVARLGTGATSSAGGTIAIGKSYALTFDVRVNGPSPSVASGTTIGNTATASFNSQSLGTPLTAESSATSTVKSPDLTIVKQHSGDLVRGQTGTYLVNATNAGDARTQGPVTVTDSLPSGLTATAATGTGWACSIAANTVTCTRSDSLAAAASYPTITVTVNVTEDVPSTVANSATVSGGGDGNLSNNSSTDTSVTMSRADLALVKTAASPTVAVGANVTWNLTVTNAGPSRSTGSTVTDTLGAGLTFVSADAGCTGSASSSTVTCLVGALNSGGSTTVHVVTRANAGTAGTSLANNASVAGRETDPNAANNTGHATLTVRPVDLQVTNRIQGDPATLTPGTSYTWLLDVRNNGDSPAADSRVRFTVPDGLTVTAAGLDPRCHLESGDVVCVLGTVAGGATVPQIQVVGQVASGTSAPAAVATTATVTTSEPDSDHSNDSASTNTPVTDSVDLGVDLSADRATVGAGDSLTLTATVTNHGLGTPANPVVVIDVPVDTTFVSAGSGCTYSSSARTVTCVLAPSALTPGHSVSPTVTVLVGAHPGNPVSSSATVSTTSADTNPANDTDTLAVPVNQGAGLSITKTVDHANAAPGDVVTYTLTARNTGPGSALDSVITDHLPGGVTFVSASGEGCTHSGHDVTCVLGPVPSGTSVAIQLVVTVDPIGGGGDTTHQHQLDYTKVESHLSLFENDTLSATATCPTGYLATDGSVRLDHVDDGTGTFSDAVVLASGVTADGHGWTGRVRNDATGQVQAKVNVVCMTERTTSGEDHSHAVIVTGPVSSSQVLAAGRHDIDLACGPDTYAITPSFVFTAGQGAVSTRRTSTGWRFTVDTPAPATGTGTFSVQCLARSLGTTQDHSHDLVFREITDTVSVPAGQVVEVRLTCAGDEKGIVSWADMDPGLVSLGTDPQPVTRLYRFYNPTGSALSADYGLLCVGIRTDRGAGGGGDITNTASVSTSTPDATASDDSASATFHASTDPGLHVASSASVSSASGRTQVLVPVTSLRTLGATTTLVALAKVKGTGLHRGSLLARSTAALHRGQHDVRLTARHAAVQALRRGDIRRAKLVITTRDGHREVRIVKIRH
ncbi:MAG: conserved repeat domain protein [Nocardioides sp.]|nr:conserved repeat domain protein [Nocardioides sp.]